MNGEVKVTNQLLTFIFKIEQWKGKHYLKQFDLNGKNKMKISDRQFQILMIVNSGECSTLTELEGLLEISSSSLSITVSKMVTQGFLSKLSPEEEDDRRKMYLEVTDKGKSLLDDSLNRVNNYFSEFLEGLTDMEKYDLKYCMEKIDSIL